MLEFTLPNEYTAVFVNFDWAGRFKTKRRPERKFTISSVSRLDDADPEDCVLGPVPIFLTRSSPLAQEMSPSAADDTAVDDGQQARVDIPLPSPPVVVKPKVIEAFAAGYPDEIIRRMGVECATIGTDPGFVGDRNKTVLLKNSSTIKGKEDILRSALMEEVKLGRIAGPFDSPPFRYFRSVPLKIIPKDKHDPASTKMRIISNFSATQPVARAATLARRRVVSVITAPEQQPHAREGRTGSPGQSTRPPSSVNDLFYNPRLLSTHIRPLHLRDVIAALGPGGVGAAVDVKSAFRNMPNKQSLLFLFVYWLPQQRKKSFKEFFVDLCNVFGARPSESGWQMVLALIMWELLRRDLRRVLAYVDNFFRFYTASEAGAARAHFDKVIDVLKELGLPLHDFQFGKKIEGLGWIWTMSDDGPASMACKPAKKLVFTRLLRSWAARTPLRMNLAEVRSAVGFMVWLSAGFHIGAAGVSSLVAVRTQLDAISKRHRLAPEDAATTLRGEAKETILFWATAFGSWSGTKTVVGGFHPQAREEVFGFVDASTTWGAGGFLVVGNNMLYFTKEWTPADKAAAFVDERESTTALELMGVLVWLQRFLPSYSGLRTLLAVDNKAAVQGINRFFSPCPTSMSPLRSIRTVLMSSEACFRVVHVLRCFNPIADLLSLGKEKEALCLARTLLGPGVVKFTRC
jgi:hypothetical protein